MAKILLVEDDNNLREIYEARMLAEGYTVVTASDGEAALAVAAKEKPELIISDVMMPKISGFEMLDILRNTEGLKTTKVIMLTALGQAEDKTRADSLGADKYLVKSQVTLEDIVNTARGLLAEEGTEGAAPATAAPTPTAAPTTPAPVGTPTLQPMAVATPPAEPASPSPVAATPAPMPEPAAPAPAAAPIPPTPVTPVTTPPATTPAAVPVTPTVPLSEPPTAPVATTPQASAMPTPAVPQPTPAAPAPVTPPAAPANTAAIDDKVVSTAVQQLLANADQSFADSQKPAQVPVPAAPTIPDTKPAITGVSNATTPLVQDISAPAPKEPTPPVTSINGGSVEVAGKKVIAPISQPESKPTLDELLAKENGEAPKHQETAVDKAPAFTPPQPGASVTPQSASGNNFDPNSISL
jgi:CheY-like chemotaxis protein